MALIVSTHEHAPLKVAELGQSGNCLATSVVTFDKSANDRYQGEIVLPVPDASWAWEAGTGQLAHPQPGPQGPAGCCCQRSRARQRPGPRWELLAGVRGSHAAAAWVHRAMELQAEHLQPLTCCQ